MKDAKNLLFENGYIILQCLILYVMFGSPIVSIVLGIILGKSIITMLTNKNQ